MGAKVRAMFGTGKARCAICGNWILLGAPCFLAYSASSFTRGYTCWSCCFKEGMNPLEQKPPAETAKAPLYIAGPHGERMASEGVALMRSGIGWGKRM